MQPCRLMDDPRLQGWVPLCQLDEAGRLCLAVHPSHEQPFTAAIARNPSPGSDNRAGRCSPIDPWEPGRSLTERIVLDDLPPDEAIAIVQQAALLVARLHQNGRSHGSLHPDNIWLTGNADGTSVRLLHREIPSGWTRAPSLSTTAPATESDDVRALYFILVYVALPREAHLLDGTLASLANAARRIADRGLRDLILRFAVDGRGSAEELSRALAPSDRQPILRRRMYARRALGIGAIALLASLAAAAFGLARLAQPARQLAAPHGAATLHPAHGPSRKLASPEARNPAACAEALLPAHPTLSAADSGLLCSPADHRQIVARVHAAIVKSTRGRATADADRWARLLWHQHAWVAVVQRICCDSPPAITLPPEPAGCDSMSHALTELAEGIAAGHEPGQAEDEFERAAQCVHLGRAGSFPYRFGPRAGGQSVFLALARGSSLRP